MEKILENINNFIYPYIPFIIEKFVISLLFYVLTVFFIQKRAKIAINKEAEKIKYEMQKKYHHLELKTRSLVDIYPKIYLSLSYAGCWATFFNMINKKIGELSEQQKRVYIKHVIEEIYLLNLQTDPTLGLKTIGEFVDYYDSSFLFIPDNIDKIIIEARKSLVSLHELTKNEFASGRYKKYSYEEIVNLLSRASIIIDSLLQHKSKLKELMNKELRSEKF